MEEKEIRNIIFSHEFEKYYDSIDEKVREKYDYALHIVRTQYLVSKKFVCALENADFYELRVSISSNEYRTRLSNLMYPLLSTKYVPPLYHRIFA